MTAELLLRRGLVDDTGHRHRRVALRPLAGREEALLAEQWPSGTAAGTAAGRAAGSAPDDLAVHALLAACVDRLGGYREVTPEHTAALTRGDRQRLALALRALMTGDQLVLTLRCPDAACAQLADLDLRVSRLLDPGPPGAQPEPEWWVVDTPDGRLRLRAPTGFDDEACAAASGSPAQRAGLLWNRLLDPPLDWSGLAPQTQQRLAATLADAGTLLDLTFVSACPACGALLELELDPFALLVRELSQGADRLFAEVHCLAFHYGWSEDAILRLPRPRRWRYLDLLRQQLEGRPLSARAGGGFDA